MDISKKEDMLCIRFWTKLFGGREMNKKDAYATFTGHIALGIPVIDKQLSSLFRSLSNLEFICVKSLENVDERFVQAAHTVAEFVRYHFHTEEKLMLLSEYPELASHKKEHEAFIWELLSRSMLFEESENSNQFVTFLNIWINRHIAKSDRHFADYFLEMPHHSKIRRALAGTLSQQTA
jgi:hemerythrin